MKLTCEQCQTLISGFLDGELDAEQQAQCKAHLETCKDCQKELRQMQQLVSLASTLKPAAPPEEVWDHFLDGVYNRIERKTGWSLFIVGAVALILFGLYLFVVEPWASALIKVLLAVPAVGLGIVFVSILRERLEVAKTDRYTREIKR